MKKPEMFMVRDAKIVFTNFAGREDKFNKDGKRNFVLLLQDLDFAEKLYQEGWNIKFPKNEEEDMHYDAQLRVEVRFDVRPPKIVIIQGDKNTFITRENEDYISILDTLDIEKLDVRVSPSVYESMDGTTKVKAYVHTLYATLANDELFDNYGF